MVTKLDNRYFQHSLQKQWKKLPQVDVNAMAKNVNVIAKNIDQMAKTVHKSVFDHWWCSPLIRAIRFTLNFMLVMGVLFGGALVFSAIEDPEPGPNESETLPNDGFCRVKVQRGNVTVCRKKGDGTPIFDYKTLNRTAISLNLRDQLNLTLHLVRKRSGRKRRIDDVTISKMEEVFRTYLGYREEAEVYAESFKDRRDNRQKIFRKWFYFANIVSTTIGKLLR